MFTLRPRNLARRVHDGERKKLLDFASLATGRDRSTLFGARRLIVVGRVRRGRLSHMNLNLYSLSEWIVN
jgi:hypothetical protein